MLSRDLLALLAELRPAVMLDYITGAPEQALCQLATKVATFVACLRGATDVQLVVAENDGCYYILRPDLLLARAADTSAVMWIAFATNGASTCCRWADKAECQAVHKQILAVIEALHKFCTLEVSANGRVFRMGDCSGAPILPSLNGWLLGYPVAYLVDAANVDAAATWLSSADLVLHRIMAPCVPLQEVLSRTGNLSEASRADLDMLCSFTIPASLLASGGDSLEGHMQRWLEGVSSSAPDQTVASCSNLAAMFHRVSMEVIPCKHRVAL
ncbi:hypothetical protein COCOBI_10-0330 [Coccomyxa sp. Obi]|nr:hypothetical protein COCOBI_10-0330 [Coccomyxa sp. Obi]